MNTFIQSFLREAVDTDLSSHIIKTGPDQGTPFIIEKNPTWGGRLVRWVTGRGEDRKDPFPTLSSLFQLFEDHVEVFDDPKLISDVIMFSNKLVKKSDSNEHKDVVHFIETLTVNQWKNTDKTMKEILEKFVSMKTTGGTDWEKEFKNKFLDEKGETFIYNNILCISRVNKDSKQIADAVKQTMSQVKDISFIQIQGCPAVSLSDFKNILDNPELIDVFMKPQVCQFAASHDQEEMILNPQLLLKSKVLQDLVTSREGQSESSRAEQSESSIELPIIKPSIFNLINNSAGKNFENITFDANNIEDLLVAADFLNIPELKNRCSLLLHAYIENAPDMKEMASRIDRLESKNVFIDSLDLHSCEEKSIDGLRTILSGLPKLKSLRLWNLNDKDFEDLHLEYLTELSELDLSSCERLTDAIGAHLEKMTQLQKLDLSSCDLTEDVWVHLEKLTQLQELVLSAWGLTDAIGPHLEKLTQLQKLNLFRCAKFTDAIGQNLEKLTQLKELDLSSWRLTNAIGPHLEKLTQLQKLNLSGCGKLTDAIGPHLEKLTQLKELDLSFCERLTDAIGPHLGKLTQLQKLKLSLWELTDAIGPHLEKLTQLKELDLSYCDKLTNAIGPHLEKLTQLKELDLSYCDKLTNAIGPHLEKLTQLQKLNLSRCDKLTDAIGPHLEKLTQLKELDLTSCGKLTDAIGLHLEKLTQLKELKLENCTRITDAIGPHIVKLTQLQVLSVAWSGTTEAFNRNFAKLSQLRRRSYN